MSVVTEVSKRARQNRVDGKINQVSQRHGFVFAQEFADAVKHHNRVVERIADDGENSRNDLKG